MANILTAPATLYINDEPILPCALTDARGNTSILMVHTYNIHIHKIQVLNI